MDICAAGLYDLYEGIRCLALAGLEAMRPETRVPREGVLGAAGRSLENLESP